MMHKHSWQVSTLVIVSIVLALFLGSYTPIGQRVLRFIKYSPEIIDLAGSKSQTFHVEGEVRDEEGNEIPKVLILVIDSTSTRMGMGTEKNERIIAVKGKKFQIDSAGYHHLLLVFTSEGYESVFMPYKAGGKYSNVIVVLRKTPATTPLSGSTAATQPKN